MSDDAPASHPIAVVAARTGLSRDVLRVWERRYHAVDPTRTLGGQRLYSDAHVHRFRLLAAATRHGRSISAVAQMGTEELARMAAEDAAADAAAAPQPTVVSDTSTERVVVAAMHAIMSLDAPTLDTLLRRAIAREGVPWFLEQFASALMLAVGDGWASGQLTIAHEHLASAAVIAITLDTIRTVPAPPSAPRLVVATPSNERHAVGAAMSAAAASIYGWSIVYLGADVPGSDIATAAANTNARAVALSVVYVEDREAVVSEIRGLRDQLDTAVPLLIGGAGVAGLARDLRLRGVILCESVAHLRSELVREAQSR